MGNQPEVGILVSYKEVNADVPAKAEDKFTNLDKKVRDTSQAFRNLADGALMLSNQFSAMGNNAIQGFAQFDQSMANVNSIVVGTQEEIDMLREKADQMGRDMPVSAQAAADGFYQLASAGKDATDIMEISDGVMQTSIATATDFARVASIVTGVQDVWKVSNEDLMTVQDTLMNTVKGYKTNMDELGLTLGYVAKSAETLGLDLATTGALIGKVRQENIDASTAGTGLRMVFAQLSSAVVATEGPLLAVKDAIVNNNDGSLNLQATLMNIRPILEGFGTDAERVAFLNQTFGARAATVAKILIDQADSIDTAAESLRVSGSVVEAYEIQAEGAQNQMEIMNSKYEEQQRVLGEKLLPAQMKILDMKIKLLEATNKLPGPLGEYAGGVMLAASEMSSFLVPLSLMINGMRAFNLANIKATASMVIHKVAQGASTAATWALQAAQWALNAAMYANPIILVVVAVVALAAWIGFLIYKYEELSDGMKAYLYWVLFGLGPIGWLIAAILLVVKHGDELKALLYKIGDGFKALWEAIKNGIREHIERSLEAFNKLMDFKKMAQEKAIEFVSELVNGIVQRVKDAWSVVWGKIKEVFDFGKRAYEAGQEFLEKFADGIVDAVEGVKGKIEDGVGKIAGFFGGSPPEFGPLKDAMDKGGPAFIKRYMENMMNGMDLNTGNQDNSRNMNWYGDYSPTINDAGWSVRNERDESIIIEEFENALKLMRRESFR